MFDGTVIGADGKRYPVGDPNIPVDPVPWWEGLEGWWGDTGGGGGLPSADELPDGHVLAVLDHEWVAAPPSGLFGEGVNGIIVLTQEDYDELDPPDPTILYVIVNDDD